METIIRNNFQYIPCRIILCCIIVLLSTPILNLNNACAVDIEGVEYFKNGKNNLDEGNYTDAVKNLSSAMKEFSLLEDYTLFYLSEAYHELGEHGKAFDTIQTLLKKYPLSPLRKKARRSEIREASEHARENLLQLLKSYVKDYPEDEEIKFTYGLFLKATGEDGKATSVFKDIYINGGALSNTAYSELNPSDIKSKDLIVRAENLKKKHEYEEAEHALRKALLIDDGSNSFKINKSLGLSLFMQKKYIEAAEIYDKIDDIYFKAFSLYRAGDREGFDMALNELIARKNRKTAHLLIAMASDKRREKDIENALTIYNDVLKNYPSEKVKAMWGLGWTYYVSGEYKKSSEIFSKLYFTYNNPKYLYWQARSIEALGDNATDLYNSLLRMDDNFYGILSYVKNKKKIVKSVSPKENSFTMYTENSRKIQRIETLLSLGMSEETVMELTDFIKMVNSTEGLIYIISKFHELGEFKRALDLVSRIPYSEKLHMFWYPIAFWDIIEQISIKFELDPLIILSVIREESRFDVDAKSAACAYGLMQIMPKTAYNLDKKLKLGIYKVSQINNVKMNIQLGTYYLKSLFNEFKSLAYVLAAYNAGELIVRKWIESGDYSSVDEFIEDIPYPETRNYVKRVITSYFQYKKFSNFFTEDTDFDIIPGKL